MTSNSTNLTAVLRTELKDLEAELRKDPRYQRMRKVRELLLEYEPEGRELEAPTSKRGKILAEVTTFLRENGASHRSNILQHLEEKGLLGKEAVPIKALAIYLSEAKDIFGNDGDGTWFLRPNAG
jgi:hypothetical protein